MHRISFVVPLLFAGILLPAYLYLAMSLASSSAGWVSLSLPFLIIWMLPLEMMIRNPSKIPGAAFRLHSAYVSMGLVTYLLVFTALKDGLWVVTFILDSPWLESWLFNYAGTGPVVFCSLAAFTVGTLRAMRGPVLKKVRIALPHLPERFSGLQIVQISDLHVGPTIGKRYVERVVQVTNRLKPDLVALTGDMVDGRVADLREDIEPLTGINAPMYYVPGNHEYYWNATEWMEELTQIGASVLLNRGESTQVNEIQVLIGGVSDPQAVQHGPEFAPDPHLAHAAAPEAHLKILLSHRPGLAEQASQAGFHLQLSGHTHGGQFFPWTLVARMAHKHFLGLSRCGDMWVYVNSGTGSWGPLLRLGTTPELTLLELVRE